LRLLTKNLRIFDPSKFLTELSREIWVGPGILDPDTMVIKSPDPGSGLQHFYIVEKSPMCVEYVRQADQNLILIFYYTL